MPKSNCCRLEGCLFLLCFIVLLQLLFLSTHIADTNSVLVRKQQEVILPTSANQFDRKVQENLTAPMTISETRQEKTENITETPTAQGASLGPLVKDWLEGKERWDPGKELNKRQKKNDVVPLKVGFPIFVASLPKSGTTSTWQYFNCGGQPASHQYVKTGPKTKEKTGACIYRNIQASRPPFQGCDYLSILTDTGYADFQPEKDAPFCYYPSIHSLAKIHEHYPNATYLMLVRNTSSWVDSVIKHAKGGLLQRWRTCAKHKQLPHFPAIPLPNTEEYSTKSFDRKDLEHFYDWHTEHVRTFASQNNVRYIEIPLGTNETGHLLEREIGIPASCWGRCKPDSKFCERLISENGSQ